MWVCYTIKKKGKETLNQSEQTAEHGTVVSPAGTPGKHAACETIQVIELRAAVTYLGPEPFMAAFTIAGSAFRMEAL